MFVEVTKQLDAWLLKQNEELRAEGLKPWPSCEIRLIGQTALMEGSCELPLAATNDVDVYADFAYPIRKQFEALLAKRGLILDPVGHEAWMPSETEYDLVWEGKLVRGLVAQMDYVLVSKAIKAPEKNRVLIVEYLALGATGLFMTLAETYNIDLEQFL